MKYVLSRLSFFIVSVWAAVTINFVLPRMMPGNPADAMFAKFQNNLTPQAMTALKLEFGFSNQPLIVQYFDYLKGLITLHWGLSFTYYPTPTKTVIAHSLPWTIGLVGITTLISVFLGTGLGILIAWRRGGALDNTLPIVSLFFQAAPYMWTGLLLLYFLSFKLGWFPLAHGYALSVQPSWSISFILSVLKHAILPGITIFLGSFSGWLIGMRNNMILTLGEDYVVFAEAKGVRPSRLMLMYAARNAILPQITSFAIAIGNVVSGSILTEVVFSYPGIGAQLQAAVLQQDYPLIQAAFLMIALSVLLANLLVDLLYSRLDPRVRAGGATV
ncbi:ABC transporter permease [Alicyclobacillus tolerans]|uniref:Peptide/nickel transport system permease protein n=2 Tax=Alicyclobacillus tolerans TaxID=90970 RepID=A0ABT9LZ52_9BACL|nr:MULTISPECIES: ABC transporter permease [Alicyclobacillus]MDP9729547.1 peptide/nickel transport system permease protein [Alicyclobacillus tengchongensis]QRF22765.1 ABC transporter permease [Alicyclobacillus sp. TC]SHK20972.1 peptide/nickel transport system permease protein [Alicyclobacillus montanus]